VKWILVMATVVALSFPARAQYRNQGVQLPNVGVIDLGTWDLVLNNGHAARQNLGVAGAIPDHGWNVWDQPTVGAGYFLALGYDLWWDNQAAVGASTTVIDVGNGTPILTLQISSGLRFNFSEDRLRPFAAVHLEYLWLIGVSSAAIPVPSNSFLSSNMFLGLRPGGGVEWIFGDEVSFQAELDFIGFLVPDKNRALGGLILPSSTLRLSYNIYF
jgi:hypothetical protein